MALIGELSDLSLAELIEFFCNQRKTGRLKIVYPIGPGFFYLKAGAVVHARFGDLRGIDAVYYALTQPNASFTFNPAFEPPEHSINQPWTSVVLEGLRRMDQGIEPPSPFPNGNHHDEINPIVKAAAADAAIITEADQREHAINSSGHDVRAFGVLLSQSETAHTANGRWSRAAVLGAIALIVAVVGVPWGWYTYSKSARPAKASTPTQSAQPASPAPANPEIPDPSPLNEAATNDSATTPDSSAAKRQAEARAKERAKLSGQEAVNTAANPQTAPTVAGPQSQRSQPSPGSAKRVTVQVTYDENGRVTQASGGDATALRIARQKRFPAGKPGSATVTIPIN